MRRYHRRMTPAPLRLRRPAPAGADPLRWLASWWNVIVFGAVLLVLALTPGSYRDTRTRAALARHTWLDTAPILLGFSMLSALLTIVLTRIVVVTAQSYGLSQYALEMVIRVLVLELIPLTAALFVALRCTIPNGAALAEMRRTGHFQQLRRAGVDPLTREVLPRLLAGAFATITLAALSCFVAAITAYIAVYQLTPAGLPAYTRMFGHVFNPSVSIIFAVKTGLFAIAVSVIPAASGANEDFATPSSRESAALQGLVRMFAVLLLLEAVSLVGNYY
jgi:phospholipid/cholesterol/gamma-HCH transport system permease protein